MPRIARLLLVSGFALSAGLALAQTPPAAPPAAAPAPAAAASTDLYPLKAGNKWTYRIDEQRTLEMKVDKFENGEATILTISNNRTVAKETVKVDKDGVYRTKINDVAIVPPLKILSLPATKGASWDVNSKVADKVIAGKFTIKDDKEKLKLKDGKEYECVMVDGPDFKVDGSGTKLKYWFSPTKGIVKLSYETGGQEGALEFMDLTEGK